MSALRFSSLVLDQYCTIHKLQSTCLMTELTELHWWFWLHVKFTWLCCV